ncbi:prepilin peptidase dependent protein B [Samsonia erythrinae]|uniref:Prepilin peptidase dependent protein B n=1 Tax=Samsonia erythrinae TaxID=160434 RepID=A0A4R3VTP8_9GAMM|nr:prepilin peptidase dependent protein B [Samsonia erythrinae]
MSHATPERKPSGFTLLEMLLALSLSSLIMLSVAQLYPLLRSQSQNSAQLVRLEQLFNQVVMGIEKDIRRAGFCAGSCQGKAITIGQYPGEHENSCLNVSYDLNRNGVWDGGEQQDAESFGYRLRDRALEMQSGAHNCRGDRWEKRFDPQEVILTTFRVQRLTAQNALALYELQLAGHWAKRPEVGLHVTRLIRGLNQ